MSLALLGAAGCAKAKAASVPDGPPLATPAPPPRELAPLEELAAVPTGSPTAEAPVTSSAPKPTPAAPRTTPRPESPKPDPVAAQPPTATPPPAAAAAEPPRELRSTPSAAVAAEEKKVREVLNRAVSDLKGVTYSRLSSERKLQYDQSKRFAEQADAALKDRNIPYAATLADKAKQLADELVALRN